MPKRTLHIPIPSFAKDYRDQRSDLYLMKKYQITSVLTFYKILLRLVEMDALSSKDLKGRVPASWSCERHAPDGSRSNHRLGARHKPFGNLIMYESSEGKLHEVVVKDISESGLKVAAINVKVGQSRCFFFNSTFFEDVGSFSFEARCAWSNPNKQEAGFQIVKITPNDFRNLQKLLAVFTFEEL